MKLLILLLTLGLLAGCSTEQQTDSEQDSTAIVSSEDAVEESVSKEELNEAEVIDDLTEYPETTAIQETIELTELTGYIVSDNPGTRILIFTNEEKQVYKSILVKDEKQLKVIDLEQNEVLIDETVPAS
ncbi:hypothetical protein SAMN04488506_1904 [Desemzia incerta]|uniref:Uncharacterized protein n=1 Tax=Desemzia incerta TaxID=82801 RepID=A0A1I5YBV2_9LACT|nr:hypothetical protein [Desemzia incerta]SFQ41692.1 hypothetical protein SAMN04488506_1904 [Desemzia incerta]